MTKAISIYLCSGCGIGDSLDMPELQNMVTKEFKPVLCKTNSILCSKSASDEIELDIKNLKPIGVLIAACSQRSKSDIFHFENELLIERVNFRENVVWCHDSNHKDTQMMAEDYLRMGMAKLNSTLVPQPYFPNNLSDQVLVIGGGITGITASLESAKAGYQVTLVEKENVPGGFANQLFKQSPNQFPFETLITPEVSKLITELETNKNISLLCKSNIEEISGEPGNFHVTINQEGNKKEFNAGAIVLATGWKPYDSSKLEGLGYGKFPDVVSNIELEALAKKGKIHRPSDGKEVQSVLFVQCAGSRDKDHLPYCSNHCCSTSLKQATYIRESNPDASVFIIYKDIRTSGLNENFYKKVQEDEQIFLTKGEVVSINEKDNRLEVGVNHTLLGKNICIPVDLIVLATGMTPSDTNILKLKYRQGNGLPDLKYGFPDSHFICFPYETRRTGIYAAGTVRAPMDIISCKEDASGAAMKAIQCIESVKRGDSVHPRSGDQSFPQISFQRCTDCKRCTEECPFGTYDENEKGTPIPYPSRCRKCGICMGACPERVINFEDFNINSVSGMIKSIHVPDEFEEKPRILAFVCENDALPAFDLAGYKRLKYSPFLRIIPVRCLGSVNKIWLSDALSKGFDGILLIGCKPGDDYQCHFIQGSELMQKRGENIKEVLDKMMLEPERIKTVFVEIDDYDNIPSVVDDFVKEIDAFGPNPFKGM